MSKKDKKKENKKDYKKLAEEYLNGWKRAKADYDNLVKRGNFEREESSKFACEQFIVGLLPVVDNFGHAINHCPEKLEKNEWVQGVLYIRKQLEDLLKQYDVEEYGKVGDKFDPNLHEAVEGEGDYIEEVKVVGYKMYDKVIRLARVSVKKGKGGEKNGNS